LIDRTKSFSKNFETISNATRNRNEGTNFDSVARKIEHWIKSAENVAELEYRKEWLNRYPVILVVSDGDMNDSYNAAQSLQVFQQTMRQIAGWEGVVVIWDVCTTSQKNTSKFEGVENVIHYLGWNLGIVNSIFSKIHDLDIIDTYTPLKSLYLSNRYELVRNNVI
jgi:predicted dinucleotide-utilizing enzyme